MFFYKESMILIPTVAKVCFLVE